MKNKRGMRLSFKLSMMVAVPILLVTLIGIWLGASKQNELSENLVQREVSGIANSVREIYTAVGGEAPFKLDGETLTKGSETLSGNFEIIDQLKKQLDVELS